MKDPHEARVRRAAVLLLISIVGGSADAAAAKTDNSSRPAEQFLLVGGPAPDWCLADSADPVALTTFQKSFQAAFLEFLLNPKDPPQPLSIFDGLRVDLKNSGLPIYVRTTGTVSAYTPPPRAKIVKTFRGLAGDRWQITIATRSVVGRAPSTGAILTVAWQRIGVKMPPAPDPRAPSDVAGDQLYCGVKSGNLIQAFLVDTTYT